MEKQAGTPHAPTTPDSDGLVAPVEKPNATGETAAADGSPEGGKTHEFNEQTNYVPKRTIITVGNLGP